VWEEVQASSSSVLANGDNYEQNNSRITRLYSYVERM
jgi:hypothetical protein